VIRGTIYIATTSRAAEEVAAWLELGRSSSELPTILDDDAAAKLRALAMRDLASEFMKKAKRKRGTRTFQFLLDRADARKIVHWGTRWHTGSLIGDTSIDPHLPRSVQAFLMDCREALGRRRGNPKFKRLSAAQVRAGAWIRKLRHSRTRLRLKARLRREAETKGFRTVLG
jgi:hypothetical protein